MQVEVVVQAGVAVEQVAQAVVAQVLLVQQQPHLELLIQVVAEVVVVAMQAVGQLLAVTVAQV
jgi:hypothetical protein